MTINRSNKDTGGLAQKTHNRGATERWARTHHLMVAMREHMNTKIRKKTKKGSKEFGAKK